MFIKRLLSSIGLVVIACAAIFVGKAALLAVLLIISCIAFRELTKAVSIKDKGKSWNALEIMGEIWIVLYYMMLYVSPDAESRMLLLMILFIAVMFIYVLAFPKFHASQVMSAYFAAIYAPVLLSFIYLTRNLPFGIYLVWLVFISSWISDTCAYCVGMLFGKHKLSPKLSPKKSIEGCIGGIAGSAIVGALYGYFILQPAMEVPNIIWLLALISAIGSAVSQIGDLAASAIKRNHDIKDYGNLIPGHGGIMDRFDSVIFTAPMIYILAMLFMRVS